MYFIAVDDSSASARKGPQVIGDVEPRHPRCPLSTTNRRKRLCNGFIDYDTVTVGKTTRRKKCTEFIKTRID